MPTNLPYTSAENQNAQRTYITETAVNYQNESDLYSLTQDSELKPINAIGLKQPLELSPNPSLMVPNLDGGTTPTIGARNLDYMQIPYAPLMQGSGETYEAVLNNNKETAEDELLRNIKSDLKQQVFFLNNYVSRGDGTVALATTSAAYSGGSPTVVVTNGTTDSIGSSQLVVNGYYTFWNSTGTTQRTGTVGSGAIKLVSKSATGATFASDLPSDYILGDIICPEIGTTDATTAIYGLPIIINNSGTYFGKSRTTYPQLQSYVLGSAGTLTAGQLAGTYFSIQQRGGYGFGDSAEFEDMLWMVLGTTQKENYYKLSLNSGAIVGSPNTFFHESGSKPKMDIGMKGFSFSWFGAPLKTCNSVRGDEIYFFNRKYLKRAILKNIGALSSKMPQSGEIWLTNGDGVPLLTRARYHDFIGQIYSPEPFKMGKIAGITITGLTTQKTTMS